MRGPNEQDPEVAADLELRERTERERGGNTEPPAYEPPTFAARFPCRAQCGAMVEVTDVTVARIEAFNAELARRGEAPLDTSRIVFCDSCRAEGRAMTADRNRRHVDTLAGYIRQLKASRNPEQERALIEQITKLGHPDVPGLIQAIRDKRTARGKKDPGVG